MCSQEVKICPCRALAYPEKKNCKIILVILNILNAGGGAKERYTVAPGFLFNSQFHGIPKMVSLFAHKCLSQKLWPLTRGGVCVQSTDFLINS